MADNCKALADEIEAQVPSSRADEDVQFVLVKLSPSSWPVVLAALRSEAGAAMRERAAAICQHQAELYGRACETDLEQPGDAGAVIALSSAARLIRSLPLQSEGGEAL